MDSQGDAQMSSKRDVTESLPAVRAPVAASVLGLSRSQFDRLVRDGVLPRSTPRLYRLQEVVPAFVQYLRDGREGSGDLAEERRLLTIAQRKQIELAIETRREQLVELDAAGRVFDAAMVIVGGQLDGLGGRMAAELAAISDPAVIRAKVFDECRRIRNVAANELEAFAARVARGEVDEGTADENG
jgi:hypothetical protein